MTGQSIDVGEVVLEARDLTKRYSVRRNRGGARRSLVAVDAVSLSLRKGEVVALVGESGSGKSTVARLLAQLESPTSGQVMLNGKAVRVRGGRSLRKYCRSVQLIFQDPFSSLNPVHRVGYILGRPLRLHRDVQAEGSIPERLAEILAAVQLLPPAEFIRKFPHELSGGQRQRVVIARALAARPSVLLADEPISMLDVSIRLGILNLLRDLKEQLGLAVLYITHDIGTARYFAERTVVMYAGELIEGGASEAVTQTPAHPYTEELVNASPDPRDLEREFTGAETEASDADRTGPPSMADGCRYAPRCLHANERCRTERPTRTDLGDNHWVVCWMYECGDHPRLELDKE